MTGVWCVTCMVDSRFCQLRLVLRLRRAVLRRHGRSRVRDGADADGRTMTYAYDAAGRLVKEGAKTYRYGYLDKVLSVTDGKTRTTYSYHVDGQLASATKTVPGKAGGSQSLATASPQHLNPSTSQPLFTGKPHVDGLGHAFLLRNYRAGLGKWLTADPLGYPDGWNQLAYCGNGVMSAVDYIGGATEPMPGYENIPNEILDGTANGGTVSYKFAGFDTQSKFDHTEITGWFYVGIELWAICVDYDRQKVWKILDVEMTFSTPTLLSKLAGKTGTVGELGGWLSAFLSRIPGIGFASTIASAIGKLEDDFADEVSEYLGQVRQLVSNELIAVRMYSKRIE